MPIPLAPAWAAARVLRVREESGCLDLPLNAPWGFAIQAPGWVMRSRVVTSAVGIVVRFREFVRVEF